MVKIAFSSLAFLLSRGVSAGEAGGLTFAEFLKFAFAKQGFNGEEEEDFKGSMFNSSPTVNPEELKKKIADEEIVGVMFYAPWCMYCQSMFPEWDEAARKLKLHKPNPINLVRFNSDMHSQAAEGYGIQSYPTIKFFTNGKEIEYDDDRTWAPIVRWVNKLANRTQMLESIDDLEHLIHDAPSVIIGLFDDPTMHDSVFKKAALSSNTEAIFAGSISPAVSKTIAEHLRDHHMHKCVTIKVGNNKNGDAEVTAEDGLPYENMECGNVPQNPQNPRWQDTFAVSVKGKTVTVKRTDLPGNPWIQELKVKCCMEYHHQEKNEPIDIPVPGMVIFTDNVEEPFTVYNAGKDSKSKSTEIRKMTEEDVLAFAEEHVIEPITYMDDDSKDKIFKQNKAILYLSVKNVPDDEAQKAELALVTALNQKKVNRKTFVSTISKEECDITGKIDKMLNLDGMTASLRIFTTSQFAKEPTKYRYDGPITVAGIKKFTEDFEQNKLSQYVKSEQAYEPEDRDPNDAWVLTGDDIEKTVTNENEDWFITVFAPWCGHCKKLDPIFKQLHQSLKHNPSMKIGKIDGTANEVKLFSVFGFPTLYLFPGKKGAKPIEYNSRRDLESFRIWLKQNAARPFTLDAPKKSPSNGVETDEKDSDYVDHAVDL